MSAFDHNSRPAEDLCAADENPAAADASGPLEPEPDPSHDERLVQRVVLAFLGLAIGGFLMLEPKLLAQATPKKPVTIVPPVRTTPDDPQPKMPGPNADESPKSVANPTRSYRRVPAFFTKVGISNAQRERIYEIRGQYQSQIQDLKREIERLEAEELDRCEEVLSEPQRKRLVELRGKGEPTPRPANGPTADGR